MISIIPRYHLFRFLQKHQLNHIIHDQSLVQEYKQHYPVMYTNILSRLSRINNMRRINLLDCTVGTGAHAHILLENVNQLQILGVDLDQRMINLATGKLSQFQERVSLRQGNFADVDLDSFDVIFADLGYNIIQVQKPEYGLSYRELDAQLDMRYNQTGLNASDIINKFSQQEIYEIFRNYGEVKQASLISECIASERLINRIEKVGQLVDICLKVGQEKSIPQVFQALRIVVNQEITSLENLLVKFKRIQKQTLALIITFHSIESDIIKRFIKENHRFVKINSEETPSQKELTENNRSRSAKLFCLTIKGKTQ